MRILIVGAGAIGQVYAYHLQKSGHEVHFYVKEKYADEMKGTQTIYPLNRRSPRSAPVAFTANGVVTSPEDVSKSRWDQVYLCMSSTGLRGEWIAPFARSVGGATVICLQSGLEDLAYLLNYFPREQIVCGMLSIISYHAPLPGETVPAPGMAYWFPPLSPSPFSGEGKRVRAVVDALNAGGYPSKVVADVPGMVALPSAILMNLIAGLELADWSFKNLNDRQKLQEICDGIRESATIISRKEGKSAPLMVSLFTPLTIKALMKLSPCVIPLPIETYLKAHFTKVGDQTRMYMKGYVEMGRDLGLPVRAIGRLTEGLKG